MYPYLGRKHLLRRRAVRSQSYGGCAGDFESAAHVVLLCSSIHNATVGFLKEHAKNDPKYAGHGIKNGVWEKGHKLRMIRSGAAALLAPDAVALSETYGNLDIYPTYSMSEQVSVI